MRISDWSSDVCSSDLVEVLVFPAWDCLPYDRVSPHRDIVARRLDVLTRLMQPVGAKKSGRPQVVVTTVNALLQRVPAPEALEGRIMLLKAGERVPAERINGFFAENGYYRVETVGEPGERSEEHTSELQSLMSISYAVFCLK